MEEPERRWAVWEAKRVLHDAWMAPPEARWALRVDLDAHPAVHRRSPYVSDLHVGADAIVLEEVEVVEVVMEGRWQGFRVIVVVLDDCWMEWRILFRNCARHPALPSDLESCY